MPSGGLVVRGDLIRRLGLGLGLGLALGLGRRDGGRGGSPIRGRLGRGPRRVSLAEEADRSELDLAEVDLGVPGQRVVDDVGEVDGEVAHAGVRLLSDEAGTEQERVHAHHGAALAVPDLLLRLDPTQVEPVTGVEVQRPLEDEERVVRSVRARHEPVEPRR